MNRELTSHERTSGKPWDASYHEGPAPWDIGRPQQAIARLAYEGAFEGAVLDAGCGTGENALLIASLGLEVLGVDVAETALAIARKKAPDRRIEIEFAASRDTVTVFQDAASVSRDTVVAFEDAVAASRDTVAAFQDAAPASRDTVAGSHDPVVHRRDSYRFIRRRAPATG